MRPSIRSIAIVSLTASAALGLAAAPALAHPASPHVSFAASSDGASAGWSHGKGSPIDLTLGSDSGSTYAMVVLDHLPTTTVADLSEPTFASNNYNAGSPRYYITLNNSDTLWGYPAISGLNGSGMAWVINNGNSYESWSAVQSAEGGATVTGADVIADGDQAPGTTDVVTALTFAGTSFN